MSNFSVFLFVCLSVGFTKKFLPANTTPRRVAANQSTHSYVNSLWSCWNAQLLSDLPPRCPFRIAQHPLLTSLEEERSHQCKIAWGECFTKSYWNGRKQQLIILLTEFQTDKKYKWLICSVTSPILKRIFLICFLDCKFRVTLFRQVAIVFPLRTTFCCCRLPSPVFCSLQRTNLLMNNGEYYQIQSPNRHRRCWGLHSKYWNIRKIN